MVCLNGFAASGILRIVTELHGSKVDVQERVLLIMGKYFSLRDADVILIHSRKRPECLFFLVGRYCMPSTCLSICKLI